MSISNNGVFIDTSRFGKSFNAIGIEANGDTGGGSVANNRVIFTESIGNVFPDRIRIGFLFDSPNVQFSGNVLSGIAEIGFDVLSGCDSIVGNDLTGLTATRWAVSCGGNANVIEENAFGPQYDPKAEPDT